MTRRNREKTREKIINGAIALLTRTGFRDFGINGVAREAECDKVLLYRYFGDLEGLLAAVAESVKFFPDPDRFLRVSVADSGYRSEAERVAALLYAYAKELRERPLTAQMINWFGIVENPMVETCENARKDFETALLEEGDEESSSDERVATRLKLVSFFIRGLASECGKADFDDLEEWKPIFTQMGETLWPSVGVRSGFHDDDDDYDLGWEKKRVEDEDFPFSLF